MTHTRIVLSSIENVFIAFLLILIVSVSSSKAKRVNIVLFQKGSLRIHDNPCLQYVEDNFLENIVPVCLTDHARNGLMNKFVESLKLDIESKGGHLISVTPNELSPFITKIASSLPSTKLNLLYITNTINDSNVNNLQSTLQDTLKGLPLDIQNNIETISLPDYTLSPNHESMNSFTSSSSSSSSSSMIFNTKRYISIPQPKMRYKVKYTTLDSLIRDDDHNNNNNSNNDNNAGKNMIAHKTAIISSTASSTIVGTPAIMTSGIELLKEYIALGDIEFSKKYTNDYIHSLSSSSSSSSTPLENLTNNNNMHMDMNMNDHMITTVVKSDTKASLERICRVFFQGEVMSGLISPYLEYGNLSPRLLVHARSVLFSNTNMYLKQLSYERPLIDRLRLEAIRKDWHKSLASSSSSLETMNNNYNSDNHSSTNNNDNSSSSSSTSSISSSSSSTNSNNSNDHGLWDIQFRYWKGYIQREGRIYSKTSRKYGNNPSSSNSNSDTITTAATTTNNNANFAPSSLFLLPPLIVLIHGFGGSLNQFSALAKELSSGEKGECCDVLAIDSIGFGQSEKPPLSYNQYIWRDQIMDTLATINTNHHHHYHHHHRGHNEKRRVILAGNSIGGFTAASVAAAMSSGSSADNGVEIVGLVLFNSAGKIDSPLNKAMTAYSTAVSTPSSSSSSSYISTSSSISSSSSSLDIQSSSSSSSFPPYQGPAPQLLRAVGKIVFSLLQPRIKSLCEWLYPTRPEAVAASGLAENVYRDSEDPGAHDVIAAGGKLPPPTTMNILLRDEYTGPVLICQGALDPLNDAKSRAALFQSIRGRTSGTSSSSSSSTGSSGISSSSNNSMNEKNNNPAGGGAGGNTANGGITVDLLQLGHCPMDEGGLQVSNSMKKWMKDNQLL